MKPRLGSPGTSVKSTNSGKLLSGPHITRAEMSGGKISVQHAREVAVWQSRNCIDFKTKSQIHTLVLLLNL